MMMNSWESFFYLAFEKSKQTNKNKNQTKSKIRKRSHKISFITLIDYIEKKSWNNTKEKKKHEEMKGKDDDAKRWQSWIIFGWENSHRHQIYFFRHLLDQQGCFQQRYFCWFQLCLFARTWEHIENILSLVGHRHLGYICERLDYWRHDGFHL